MLRQPPPADDEPTEGDVHPDDHRAGRRGRGDEAGGPAAQIDPGIAPAGQGGEAIGAQSGEDPLAPRDARRVVRPPGGP